MQSDPNTNLVWIDIEMTGLDLDKHKILEIATLITNKDLEIIGEGPIIAIKQPSEELEKMNEWSQQIHQKSGLLDRVKGSIYSEKDAEKETLDFIKKYVKEGTSPLCGNSVYNDRHFIIKHMPTLDKYLHYRLIDVTTLKELYRLWKPDSKPYKKSEEHKALVDVKESIEELKYYRENFLKL